MEQGVEAGNEGSSFCGIANVLNHISDVFYIIDKEWRFIYVNKAVERITSKNSQELIGRNLWDIIDKNHNLILDKMLCKALNAQREVHFESAGSPTKGWSERHIYPTENGLVVIQHDITQRKQLEEKLQESEKKLVDFAKAMPDISFILDEDGTHVEVFGNNDLLLPKPREELKGLTLHQVFPQEQADVLLSGIRQTISTGKQHCLVREMRIGQRYIEGRAAPMSYQVNGKKTVAVVVIDVTERRKAERMLQSAYELQRKSDLFNDIISGKIPVGKKTITSAKTWGADFSLPMFCCLVDIAKSSDPFRKLDQKPNKLQFIRNNIIENLSGQPEYVVWDCRGYIGFLCQAGQNDGWEKSMEVAGSIQKRIEILMPCLAVTMGVGGIHMGPHSLGKSFEEAQIALFSTQCEDEKGPGIYHYRNLGVYQLLTTLGGKENASKYVRKMIGPLIDYDCGKGTSLLRTLEAILYCSNLKEAAQKLYLHHKTLVFRKQRIEKIIGNSLDPFETRLALATAIKLYKLNNFFNK
ncbi:PAS domain S-box protein [Candidatus Formimonas warabiya]|uniref:PAS domain-containing protein n=1 Tax=Formimonas warabiya TaxID=1761012 RepID=A0A3G1KVH1_FORW1|nr:PAS domain S-box protein [Candidatus Formimonas warabiya]ATW26454.1 hypothetical protein DCMF_18395 [Candidatus Formimonas warabiya]